MNLSQLLLLLLKIGLGVTEANLSGKPLGDVQIADGTLQLVQVALQAHALTQGKTIEEVIATLQPYTPINPPGGSNG